MGVDPITATLVAISAAGTASSYSSSRKAAKENKEAGKISLAQQQVEAGRQRRQVARQSRVRRAQIMQAAQNTGIGGSSAAQGAIDALSAQEQAYTGYLSGSEVGASAISRKTQNAAENQFKSQISSSIAQISGSLAASPEAKKAIKNIFT